MKRMLALAALMTATLTLQAGLVLDMENRMSDDAEAVQASRILIEGKALRIEAADGAMVYSSGAQKMWGIDHAARQYTEIDKAAIKGMADQMSAAMKQMQEQLAQMPPEQRAMMQEMMGKSMPGLGEESSPTEEIRKTAETDTINGHKCVKYEVYLDGRKRSELWVADWKQLGVTKDDFTVFSDLTAFYGEMLDAFKSSGFASMELDPFKGFDQTGGFPVLVKTFDEDGQVSNESLLKAIRKEAVDKNLFQLPAGYRRVAMPGTQEEPRE